jgi:hypothetical protein
MVVRNWVQRQAKATINECTTPASTEILMYQNAPTCARSTSSFRWISSMTAARTAFTENQSSKLITLAISIECKDCLADCLSETDINSSSQLNFMLKTFLLNLVRSQAPGFRASKSWSSAWSMVHLYLSGATFSFRPKCPGVDGNQGPAVRLCIGIGWSVLSLVNVVNRFEVPGREKSKFARKNGKWR